MFTEVVWSGEGKLMCTGVLLLEGQAVKRLLTDLTGYTQPQGLYSRHYLLPATPKTEFLT